MAMAILTKWLGNWIKEQIGRDKAPDLGIRLRHWGESAAAFSENLLELA